MSIQVIKLNCGDEVIGDMRMDGDKLVVEKPARVMLVPVEGGAGFALMPWFPYAEDKEYFINGNAIITRFNPTEDLTNEYRKNFGSGLDIPTTPQIIA